VTYHIGLTDNINTRSHQANTFSLLLEKALGKHLEDIKGETLF